MATNTTPRLAFTVAALLLAAPIAHAEQYCTPQSGWQDVTPGHTITLQCEGEGAVTVYPSEAMTAWGGSRSGYGFAAGPTKLFRGLIQEDVQRGNPAVLYR